MHDSVSASSIVRHATTAQKTRQSSAYAKLIMVNDATPYGNVFAYV